MEKILVAIDAQDPSIDEIDFACYLARLTNSNLTGIFLEDLLYGTKPVMKLLAGTPYVETITIDSLPDHAKRNAIADENIRRFREACENRCIQPKVHRDRGLPPEEIVEESRFADLIVIDPATTFSRSGERVPGHFVRDVLHETECPIIISPYSFDSIDEIFFTYNGTKSSVFAIKQFTYLFPELRSRKVTIVSVKNNDDPGIEEQYKLKEWLKPHYNDPEFVLLKGEPADQLFGYLIEKKNGIVVMGAFGRSMLSRFFKPSHARLIVKAINLPIFIAHY